MINYESPVFVSIVLITIYVLLFGAVLLTVWSACRSLHLQGKAGATNHGVPARRIALLSAAGLLLTMVVTWLTGSTKPLTINGRTYDDAFWLRTSDMLINTALVAIVALAVLVAIATIANRLKKN